MDLFAVFETWHLGDGNYPALKKGELANLSFEIEPDELTNAEASSSERFHHCGHAEYEFTGTVLRTYGCDTDSDRVVVIQADQFRFYISSPLTAGLLAGSKVSGRGTLALDHYLWVEFLSQYPDPPDLFYNLRVAEITRAKIPERFITRSGLNVSYPTRVPSEEYVTEVDSITDEGCCTFYVHFSDDDVPAIAMPRTFQ
jgi:hypothetical protein